MKKYIVLSALGILLVALLAEKFISFSQAASPIILAPEPASDQKQEKVVPSSSAKDVFLIVRSGYLSERGLMFLNDSYDYKKSKVTLLIDCNQEDFKGLKVSRFLNMKVMVKATEEESRSVKIQWKVESISYVKENK